MNTDTPNHLLTISEREYYCIIDRIRRAYRLQLKSRDLGIVARKVREAIASCTTGNTTDLERLTVLAEKIENPGGNHDRIHS